MGDYLAARKDWDAALLCLSVNMIGAKFSVEQFRERTGYILESMAKAHPGKPLFCLTILPYFRDFLMDERLKSHGNVESYRQAFREAARHLNSPNVHVIEGTKVLQHIEGLTTDLIPPGDYGMAEIAENLAKKMKPILNRQGLIK